MKPDVLKPDVSEPDAAKADALASVAGADPFSRKKVLVADDSSAVRQLAARLLGEAGYEVLCAVDGFDALALLGRYRADMLVCDMDMPRLDGLQTCTLVRRNARFSGLPVLMVSTRQGVFDRARSAMAGADEFMGKPFSGEALLQHVRAYVDGVEVA